MSDFSIKSLDDFGRALMVDVRDGTFEVMRKVLSGELRGRASEDLHEYSLAIGEAALPVVKQLIASAIDGTIARFLHFLEEREVGLVVVDDSGRAIDLAKISDGLAGELFSDVGWMERFSRHGESLPGALSSIEGPSPDHPKA